MRTRGWGLGLVVLAALGALVVAGRLLDLPQDRRAPTGAPPSTAPVPVASVATPPLMGIPESLRRPVRLPSLGATAPGRPRPRSGRR